MEQYEEQIQRESAFWDDQFTGTEYSSYLFTVDAVRERVTHRTLDKMARLIKPGDRVLDFGCGGGWLSFLLAPSQAAITGIDIAEKCIVEANRKAEREGIDNCRFERADLNYHTLPDGHYDAVVSVGALHHLLRLEHAYGQIERALKPDGLLMVWECVDRGGLRGKLGDFLADACHMVLPTDRSYGFKLRHALSKLKGEEVCMQALSPMEGVGSGEWMEGLTERFEVIYREAWFGLVTPFLGRIKPTPLGIGMTKILFQLDRLLVGCKVLEPELHFMIARKKR